MMLLSLLTEEYHLLRSEADLAFGNNVKLGDEMEVGICQAVRIKANVLTDRQTGVPNSR